MDLKSLLDSYLHFTVFRANLSDEDFSSYLLPIDGGNSILFPKDVLESTIIEYEDIRTLTKIYTEKSSFNNTTKDDIEFLEIFCDIHIEKYSKLYSILKSEYESTEKTLNLINEILKPFLKRKDIIVELKDKFDW